MGSPIFRRRVSDAEKRLTILYCVSALEQVTSAQLWQFISEADTMDYMTAMLILGDLVASGELDSGEHALKGRVYLSDKGRRTLDMFMERIPKSVRDSIDSRAPDFRAQLRQRRQVSAIYESAQTGDYRLILSLIEGDLPAIEMRLHTHRRRAAAKIKAGFVKTAPTVIQYLYELASEGARGCDIGEAASIEQLSKNEYRVTAKLSAPPIISMDIAILLPSRESAYSLLSAIDKEPRAVGSRLLGLLTA